MGLLDWFRQSTPRIDEGGVSEALIDETIDYVVKMTDARLALVHHYRQRLTGPVRRTLQYIQTLRASMPEAHEVGPLSWTLDPCMRAFFGQPSELRGTFALCQKLNEYANSAPPLAPIFAVLAMEFVEQRRFGVGLQGDLTVRDIAQTALSFSQHRLRLFAGDEQGLWRHMARRMLDELALIALEHMQAEQAQRRELEEHRSLLSARLATFSQRGAGADSFLGEAGSLITDEESDALLRQLDENEAQLGKLGCSTETLDHQLDYLAEVLAEPMNFVRIERKQIYLDSMNILVAPPAGDAIDFGIASFDRHPPQRRAFLPVRVDPALIGQGRRLKLDKAERWL